MEMSNYNPPPSLQIEVIRWLLSHNPHDRPTSKQLLQSPLLPLKMEDEELQEVRPATVLPLRINKLERP